MRSSGYRGSAAGAALLLALALIVGAARVEAVKPQAAVVAAFESVPATVPLGVPLHLVLRLSAFEDAPDVTVEVLPSDGIRLTAGPTRWTGGLARSQEVRVSLTIELTAAGEHTLGARVTVRRSRGVEVSGTALGVRASATVAELSPEPAGLLRMRAAVSLADLRGLGIAPESPAPSAAGRRLERRAAAASVGTGLTVTGQIRWLDPEGASYPVRRAYVEVLEASTGSLLARTATDDAGAYAATVAAGPVTVVVYTRDAEGKRVEVTAPGEPALRYVMESAGVPLVDAVTVVDITSAATLRGAPGAPSADSLPARAFAAYEGMLAYWVQATALIGTDLERVRVVFPAPTAGGCGTTCYVAASGEIFVLREDAFDWDVLGHEFFHFVADRAAPRTIDRNPGGGHGGGSAIGQPPRPGAPGRSRDEGMRLAWSEGLATFMSLALQREPPDPTFDFPRSLASVGDLRYQDSEDIEVTLDPEAPPDSEGFGSASSVLGLLWDLFDAAADGPVTDTIRGVDPRLLWTLITRDLPCDPCDRVDRVWTAVTRRLGVGAARTLEVARVFALNRIAPEAVSPPVGAVVSTAVPPTFSWVANGDPSDAHRNDRFVLALSRDDFQGHLAVIEVPALGATSYTPTRAEWASALAGASEGTEYEWLVAGIRHDDPPVPDGWYWYSNALRFRLGD